MRKPLYPRFLLLLGVTLVVSCGGPEAGQLAGKNLLLISIDTARADHTSPYGRDIETPTLQRLADEGILFEEAVTPVPLTQPAHTSLFTGNYPGRHGVRDNASHTLSQDAVTLAECFQEAGYQTGAAVGTMVISKRSGLDQGFDTYDDEFTTRQLQTMKPVIERGGGDVRDSALRWFRGRDKSKPFAYFAHFYDPHLPYEPPEDIRAKYPMRPYDGEIMHVDRCLGRIIGAMEAERLLEETLVVLVTDHGECLWEHHEQTHGLFLYDAAMLVAMIFRFPGETGRRGARITTPVSLIDVMPTLLELYDLPAPEMDGTSLAPLFGGGSIPARDLYGETLYPLFFNWSPSYSVRRGGWKFIQSPEPELYDLNEDPKELENLLPASQSSADSLSGSLTAQMETWAAEGTTSEARMSLESAEAMAALGYTGGAAVVPDDPGALPDMKTRTDVYHRLGLAMAQMGKRQFAAARVQFEKLAEEEPTNPSVFLNLGDILGNTGDYAGAEAHFRICLDLAPNNRMAKTKLGKLLFSMERTDEAEAVFDDILHDTPKDPEVNFFKGKIQEKRGEYKQALEFYEKVEKLLPGMPGLGERMEAVGG